MTDRPASWRLPTPKQMEKLAAAPAVGRNAPPARALAPGDDMPPEYWDAVLRDAGAHARRTGRPANSIGAVLALRYAKGSAPAPVAPPAQTDKPNSQGELRTG